MRKVSQKMNPSSAREAAFDALHREAGKLGLHIVAQPVGNNGIGFLHSGGFCAIGWALQ